MPRICIYNKDGELTKLLLSGGRPVYGLTRCPVCRLLVQHRGYHHMSGGPDVLYVPVEHTDPISGQLCSGGAEWRQREEWPPYPDSGEG